MRPTARNSSSIASTIPLASTAAKREGTTFFIWETILSHRTATETDRRAPGSHVSRFSTVSARPDACPLKPRQPTRVIGHRLTWLAPNSLVTNENLQMTSTDLLELDVDELSHLALETDAASCGARSVCEEIERTGARNRSKPPTLKPVSHPIAGVLRGTETRRETCSRCGQ